MTKSLAVLALLLSGCPARKEPLANSLSTGYPQETSDTEDRTREALRESTPDDTKFPFDPEGTNCPQEP